MEGLTYIYIFTIAQFFNSESSYVVIQEGTTFTSLYSENVNYNCDTFLWIRKNIKILQCYENKGVYLCNQPPFTRNAEATVNVNNNVATTNLTIANVYRNCSDSDEGVWSFRCIAPTVTNITSFEMKLYQKPSNIQCGHMFQANGLTVNCRSQGIYPQANVYSKKNHSSGNISTCENLLDSTNLYYNSTCTFTIPYASLNIGTLDITITVYPNVTALINDTNFGNSTMLSLNLETPKISLTNCQENDIIEETPFSCTCERSDVSDILTNTSWLINGTEYSSSSSNISVLNNVGSRYKTDYTCIAVNVFGWKSIPFIYTPNVLYTSEIISLMINDKTQKQTVVDNQSMLKIICNAIGNPEPSLYLTKDKNELLVTTNNNFTLSLKFTVSCMDSGIYICSARNTVGETPPKSSTVFVKCPQQLQRPSTNELVVTATKGNDVSLNISVFGYPKPDMYNLIRRGINKVIFKGSVPLTNVSTKYYIAYYEDYQNLIYGNVTFTIFNMSSEDFANYTLVIYNGGNLTYKLSIENGAFRSSRQINGEFNWPAVGGGLGAALLVILIAVLCFNIVSRRSKNYTDDLVAISNQDLYWIDVNNGGYINYGDQVQAKIYDMEYVSPITTACSPPGNYENFFKRK